MLYVAGLNSLSLKSKPSQSFKLHNPAAQVCAWLEHVSEGPALIAKEYAAKEMVLSGPQVRQSMAEGRDQGTGGRGSGVVLSDQQLRQLVAKG